MFVVSGSACESVVDGPRITAEIVRVVETMWNQFTHASEVVHVMIR